MTPEADEQRIRHNALARTRIMATGDFAFAAVIVNDTVEDLPERPGTVIVNFSSFPPIPLPGEQCKNRRWN